MRLPFLFAFLVVVASVAITLFIKHDVISVFGLATNNNKNWSAHLWILFVIYVCVNLSISLCLSLSLSIYLCLYVWRPSSVWLPVCDNSCSALSASVCLTVCLGHIVVLPYWDLWLSAAGSACLQYKRIKNDLLFMVMPCNWLLAWLLLSKMQQKGKPQIKLQMQTKTFGICSAAST